MNTLILARHAESEWNVRGALNGDASQPGALSPGGREQARWLGEALAGTPIDLVVTSPFQRTSETAEIALAGRDVPRLVVAELSEHPAGDYEGRQLDEYIAWAHAHGSDVCVPVRRRRAVRSRAASRAAIASCSHGQRRPFSPSCTS